MAAILGLISPQLLWRRSFTEAFIFLHSLFFHNNIQVTLYWMLPLPLNSWIRFLQLYFYGLIALVFIIIFTASNSTRPQQQSNEETEGAAILCAAWDNGSE